MAGRRHHGGRARESSIGMQAPATQTINRGGTSNGMVFVATPPTRAPSFVPDKRNGNGRVLKRPVNTANNVCENNQASDVNSQSKSFVAEKLAFDELLRIQRGRAEDVAQWIGQLGTALGGDDLGNSAERSKARRAALFREEWRIARENEVLEKLKVSEDQEHLMSAADQIEKLDALRSHIKRSIHLFLSVERDVQSATPKKRLSYDLFYAQQMDRLLRQLDSQHPFETVRLAIADARGKTQQLLNSMAASPAPAHPIQDRADTTTGHASEQPVQMLNLYENVVDARARIVPQVLMKSKASSYVKALRMPSETFTSSLKKQRELAQYEASEILALSHRLHVHARRIQRTYRKHQTWRRRQALAGRVRSNLERRSALILQTKFRCLVAQYRRFSNARLMIMRRNQGKRVAQFCFWRWIYPLRCGYHVFTFNIEPTAGLAQKVTLIQAVWRRWRAWHVLIYLRAFAGHRARRRKRIQWKQYRLQSMSCMEANRKLAEWNCHVAIEKARVAREIERESSRFTVEWAKYEARLEKEVMKSRLSPEWIPQLDPLSGETFYLNIKTTRTSQDHPNLSLFRQLIKKQRVRAEQLYEERQERLQVYLQRLEEEHRVEMEKLFAEILR